MINIIQSNYLKMNSKDFGILLKQTKNKQTNPL